MSHPDHAFDNHSFETRAIHVGQEPDPTTGATIPPLYLTSTYTQSAPGEHKGYDYSRSQNPTKEALEKCLASLEGGAECGIFASGLAATSCLLQSLRPGDGVVAGHDLYGGTYRILERVFKPWGLEIVYAADEKPESYRAALKQLSKPKLVWLETPTNPMLGIVDIEVVAGISREFGCKVAVDNTFASPYLQSPIKLGADYVIHSTTKYLGGHSDVVGGALIAKNAEEMVPLRFLQNAQGGVAGPFDAWLVMRGVKTLAVRMDRHCDNAEKFATAIQSIPGVEKVIYPGLANHPGHATAKKQMRRFGGMVSVSVKGGLEGASRIASRLRVISLAESLGGVESLVNHPAKMTHASIPAAIRVARGVDDGLLRFSVGIENVDDLIADVKAAAS